MRLDPERTLAPATIAAIQDLIECRAVPIVDDSALLAVALGVADAPTRLACARAILAYPSVRARLLVVRASVSGSLNAPNPGPEDREDLGRLSAFAAPFDKAAAEAVFPARFGEGLRLARLAEGGWLEATNTSQGPVYRVPDRFRKGEVALGAEETDRFIRYFAELVRWIDRGLAEGQWVRAIEVLRRTMPDLRAAWRFADATGNFEGVATFVDALAAELMESGDWNALADLATAGYRASDALNRPGLRSKLLSYEGAAASRQGDSADAIELWSARVELNRTIGNAAAEADALLDLLGQAVELGDAQEWRRWIEPAKGAVGRADRADLWATLWAACAEERLSVGDREKASAHAEQALAAFSGNLGLDNGLFVRLSAAKILARSGRPGQAIRFVADLLDVAVESGRFAHAAAILTRLAGLLEEESKIRFAERCLQTALMIQRLLGVRGASATEVSLDELRSAYSIPYEQTEPVDLNWEAAVQALLIELREYLPEIVLA